MNSPELTELRTQGQNIIKYMKLQGMKISALNIVYLEGLEADDLKTLNNDRIDYWNDVRTVIGDDGRVFMSAIATTEAGWYYRQNRLNPAGCAQLAFGQYLEAWAIGDHKGQVALVQRLPLLVYRDDNEDGSRSGDRLTNEADMGLNQHTTRNEPELVGGWSAACLVGKYKSTHRRFMEICKGMGVEYFDTTLLDASKFIGWCNESN
jgi:hypothetical protein